MEQKCVYCNTNAPSNSEHVFPRSLGGQSLYMNCVCDTCNNKFSNMERELIQKSIVGIMKSAEGLGTGKGVRKAPLKYREIFQYVETDGFVYEVGVEGFIPYYLPQIFKIENEFYCEASSQPELDTLLKKFDKWRHTGQHVTILPKGKKHKRIIKFTPTNNEWSHSNSELTRVKDSIILLTLSNNHEYSTFFTPRLYLDNDGQLIIRCVSEEEGINFFTDFLNECGKSLELTNYKSQGSKEAVMVSMEFNLPLIQRAFLKIGLNSVMYYYPKTINSPFLQPIKNCILDGESNSLRGKVFGDRIELIDKLENTHTILFSQNNKGLIVRVCLFGSVNCGFFIEGLKIHDDSEFMSIVEINYKTRTQKHIDFTDFLINTLPENHHINTLGLSPQVIF